MGYTLKGSNRWSSNRLRILPFDYRVKGDVDFNPRFRRCDCLCFKIIKRVFAAEDIRAVLNFPEKDFRYRE